MLKVRQPKRLPRPLSDEQVTALVDNVACPRDRAMLLLMLNGAGCFVRVRDDHPDARQKSRSERVVDLFDTETLAAVSDYMISGRPSQASSPFLFLVGGKGSRRSQPLSYGRWCACSPALRHGRVSGSRG